MLFSSILLGIITLLLLVQIILSESKMSKDSSLSPLESGFESIKMSSSASSPFFFLAILFVLFDLELVLLFPAVLDSFYNMMSPAVMWSMIVILMLVTLMIEWAWCGLKWQV